MRKTTSDFRVLFYSVSFFTAAHASPYFQDRQVLTSDKSADLIVWRVDSTTSASDPKWACARADSGFFRFSSCSLRGYERGTTSRDQYLYWAFLNIAPRSDRADLAPRDFGEESFFRGLHRPLLAMKQRNDSCLYLILFRDQLAPLAGGKVSCPDLRSGFEAVGRDLEGRTSLIPQHAESGAGEKIYRKGTVSTDAPHALDVELEGSVALALPLNNDVDADPNDPFSQSKQTFDFEDYAGGDSPPAGLRATLLYADIVGLRIGYAYSTYKMSEDVRSQLAADTSLHGAVLSDWKINRKDYSVELLLGGPFISDGVEFPLYGFMGFSKTYFKETAVIDGRDYPNQNLLSNETAFLIGAGMQLKFPYVYLGLELGALVKDFEFRNAPPTEQPDGSGSEIQVRLFLGGYHRTRFK